MPLPCLVFQSSRYPSQKYSLIQHHRHFLTILDPFPPPSDQPPYFFLLLPVISSPLLRSPFPFFILRMGVMLMRDRPVYAINLTSTGDLITAINGLSSSPAPVASLQFAIDEIRNTMLPQQGRGSSSPDVETVVLLVASAAQSQTSGLRTSAQALRGSGSSYVASLLVPTTSGSTPSSTLRTFFANLSSTPAAQHVFTANVVSQLRSTTFSDSLVEACFCRAAIIQYSLDLASGQMNFTFSRQVLPANFNASAVSLVEASNPEAGARYRLRIAAAPERPGSSSRAARSMVQVTLPQADRTALLSQQRLAQQADTTLLEAEVTALSILGTAAGILVNSTDRLTATTLTGPLRPAGVRDLIPVDVASRSLTVSLQPPAATNGVLTSAYVLCQGPVNNSEASCESIYR